VKRLFWLALGATVGVLVFRKVRATAEHFTPRGIAGSVSGSVSRSMGGLGDALRDFADDVRAAMTEREDELMSALGVDELDDQGT
jgi:hypothetical protein